MRRGLAAVAVLAFVSACATGPTPAPPAVPSAALISPEGMSPVRIGMSVAEASAALGAPLVPDMDFDEPEACQTLHPQGAENSPLYYMAVDGRISRISVYEGAPLIRTAAGVGVGSSDADVRAAYTSAIQEPAPYDDPPAHDLIVWTAPDVSGLRFEVNGMGKVVVLHAGGPSILYIEGCL